MTLVSDIIKDAYRESNITAISANPSAAQSDEALRILNRLLSSVFGTEEGDRLKPFPVGSLNVQRPYGFINEVTYYDDWTVPSSSRLMLNLEEPMTIYLNPIPEDGARFGVNDKAGNLSTNPLTIVANGRTIGGDLSQTINTDGYAAEWFYRDDLGDWLKVTPILATDEFPFPQDYDDFFIVGLAMRLNPRNGAAMDPQSMQAYNDAKRDFKSAYHQVESSPSELGLIRTSSRGINRYETSFGTDAFNSGYPYPYDYNPWGN